MVWHRRLPLFQLWATQVEIFPPSHSAEAQGGPSAWVVAEQPMPAREAALLQLKIPVQPDSPQSLQSLHQEDLMLLRCRL